MTRWHANMILVFLALIYVALVLTGHDVLEILEKLR